MQLGPCSRLATPLFSLKPRASGVRRADSIRNVLKDAAAEELVVAIREALVGRTYITPRIANEVLHNLMSHPTHAAQEGNGLTGREREVLQLLAEGKIIKQLRRS